MEYPSGFPADAKAHVEAEQLRASQVLEQARATDPTEKCAFYKYILRVFLAFAHECCEVGKRGGWAVDAIRKNAEEFLRRLTIDALSEKGHHLSRPTFTKFVSDWDGSLMPDVVRLFHDSEEWRTYEGELLAVADAQAARNAEARKSARTESGPAEPKPTTTRRKRGRPQTIPDERKVKAAALKSSGGTNSAVASVLYDKKFPTPQEVKNVSSHLRAFSKKLKRPGSSVQTPPKSPKING